ncbi:MAG: thymidine phosphorylase [Acidobacteria bacterium]|nr:thymidine phosphorylase [Acidobacteriota bacterium]
MRTLDIIAEKRNGRKLSSESIRALVEGYVQGQIPDYQVSAFLMAVYFRSMDDEETVTLTRAIIDSGVTVDFSGLPSPAVGKHSTGGVGDKTSLIVAPLAASCGMFVPMISGRGLGHTGGTLDKLESIPGFNVNLSLAQFKEQVGGIGCALIGQTAELAPADKKLYALRDVTATVESIPLIVASIISKKVAEGDTGLVLDVKTGSGAFMKTLESSRALAEALVRTGRLLGMEVTALITSMEEPLGHAVGNSVEVVESVEVLRGGGPEDLREVSLALAAEMALLAGKARSLEEAGNILNQKIVAGDALEKFRQIIAAQGGDPRIVDDDQLLPMASHRCEVKAPRKGFVKSILAEPIGKAAMLLGAGRETVEAGIDPAAAVWVRKKTGEEVDAGEPLCTLEFNDDRRLREAIALAESAFALGDSRPDAVRRILERIAAK